MEFQNFICVCMCVLAHTLLLSCVQLFETPWTVAFQFLFVDGIFQVRVLEWIAISSSRGSSLPMDRTYISFISWIGMQVLYHQR